MLPAPQGTALPRRAFGLRPLAMLGAALLVGAGLSTAAVVSAAPASAAVQATQDSHFVCDQNTLYATNSAGKVVAIDITTGASKGTTVDVADLGTGANNGLGISREGTSMFAAGNNTTATLRSFDPKTNTASGPVATDKVRPVLRGAVNPVTGIYYYGDSSGALLAYDPATKKAIGQVGTIPNLKPGNGDFAFSSRGLFFVVAADKVYRVDTETVPTTAGTTALTTTEIATLPSGTDSPGIAFSSDGYLYVSNSVTTGTAPNTTATTTLMQLDPTSGAQVRRFPVVGDYNASDLATCNYADTVTGRASVDQRWKATDQFGLAITGDGITATSKGTSASTTGSATGLQDQKAGAILTTPGKKYTVAQTAAGTTDLANYTTTWKALDVNSGTAVAAGTGQTAGFTFPQAVGTDGTDVVVTFTNTLKLVHASTTADTYSTPVDTTLTVPAAGVLANDAGTGLTVTNHTDPTSGTLTMSATDGSFTYTPDAGSSGTDQFDYTATDGSGQTSTSTVTITVTPTATDDAFSVHAGSTATADAAHGLLANDHGSRLSITGNTTPAHGSLTLAADGSYTYTPDDRFSGADSFTYTAKDGSGATITGTVSITVLPTAKADTISATAGQTTTVAAPGLLGNDLGTGLTVTDSTTPAHGTVTVGTDGTTTYTPAPGYSGPDSFDVTITDGNGESDTVTVTVRVAPKAVDDTATVDAGSSVSTTTRATGVLGNDSGTALTVTNSTAPGHGTLVLDATAGTYTYTPTAGFSGTDRFDYTATDGSGATTSATVTITVRPAAAVDTATTPADHPVIIDVQANDSGTGLTTTVVDQPQHGAVAVATDGTVQYTPAVGTSGTDSFTYTATDAAGRTTAPVTVTVTVTPVATNDAASAQATKTLTIPVATLLGNDSGTGLTITKATGTSHADVTLGTDGTITYTAKPGFSGTDTVTYTVTDASGQPTTATITVVVGPMAKPDTATATAGTTLTVATADGVLANDQGSDLRARTDRAPANGTLDLHADGSYTYTPADGFSGTDTFTYTATDGSGGKSTGLVTVTVRPKAQDDRLTTTAGTPLVVTAGTLTGNDAGTGLTVTAVTDGAHTTVVLGTDGAITITPADGTSGTDSSTYTVTDAAGNTSTATVRVLVAPVATDDAGTVRAGETLTRTTPATGVLGNDRGTGLSITHHTEPGHGVLVLDDTTGAVKYTPVDGFSGDDSFTYTVADTAGTPATATMTLVVTPATVDDRATTSANWPVTVDVQANDSGVGLHTELVGAPAHGSVVLERDGTVTYAPAAGTSGTDTFTYRVTDASGRPSGLSTVTVTVLPVAMADTVGTVAGKPVSIPAATLLGNDSGTGLAVTKAGGADHGDVTLGRDGTDGTIRYTPTPGFSGTDTITYTVTDASSQSATATVIVVVGPMAAPDTVTATAGSTRTVAEGDGVLANDRGTGLTATVDQVPAHGTLDLHADGSYSYTPADGFSGTDRATYTATDGAGAKATGTVTITVRPAAGDDTRTTTAGQPVTATSAALTADDAGTGVHVTDVTDGAHGTATVDVDGTVTYVPTAGWSGTDTVTVTVTDAIGSTATSTLTITVIPVLAVPDATATADGQLVVPAGQGVLTGSTGTDLEVTGHGTPDHGTVYVGKDGSYTYTPAPGYSGPDGFDVTVTDGSGGTTTGTVTITVAPKVVDDTATTTAGSPVAVAVTGNDSGTSLRVTAVGRAVHGTVSTTGAGTVTYAPAAGFSGTDTFRYTVVDPTGGTASATVTVTVTPTATADVLRTAGGRPLTIAGRTLTGNDSGTGLTVTGLGDARHGTVTTGTDGGLVYTPAAGSSGTDRFTYTVTDAAGQTTTATVTVLVGAVAVDDWSTTTTNGTVRMARTHGVLSDDSGTGLWASVDLHPQHGTLRLAKDGSYVYAPSANWSGRDWFTYTAHDAEENTAVALVAIDVTPTATADTARTTAGTAVTVRGPGVLGNDRGTTLRVVSVGTAAHGTATIAADGTFVYTPAAGFSGTDTVPYTVRDASGQTVDTSVTVTVGIAAADDTGRTVAGTALAVDARHGLLGNDSGTGLTTSLARAAAHGTVRVQSDGSYVYTPAARFTGRDTFDYTVTDASGQTTRATATITVVAAAVATDDRGTGRTGRAVTVEPLDNDSPTGGATFDTDTLHLVDPATGHMTDRVTVRGSGSWHVEDGVVTFTPARGFHGTEKVDYTVQDSAGQVVTATITVTYPVGIAAVAHVAQLAFTGSTGLAGLGLGALALLLAGAALLLRRRMLADGSVGETGPVGPRRRR
ncbi:Ig-like domain-containing protein [Curtobacterium sp. CFBP9011]|uniref:Ig-like domain-containing protein n=1 Tax=Curtobacterium sp. CFBP9011 TaxID=3096530 RepID=UPI002A6B1AB9|nr:Ig-like domain-containing protein [Curtobacterium sp. CFBP9011]MDY1005563.1 Ig-like domain-containing protein [Curtobacterium sp. CFBP9011]